MAEIHCRHFDGYKPCGRNASCDHGCPHRDIVREHILVIHLGALGAVLRSTALLPAIRRQFPKSLITWVTGAPADQLLKNNPQIDRVLTLSAADLIQLDALAFDLVFCIDKSLTAAGIAARVQKKEQRGFRADPFTGHILPANPDAQELWHIGLDNYKKFFENTKTENRLVHEALALGEYRRDEYIAAFDETERELSRLRKKMWASSGEMVIGLNTGCSPHIPYKKLSVEYQRRLIQKILDHKDWPPRKVVLLGGPEDSVRNREIAHGLDVISSPVDRGLRDGLVSVAACDLVVTGDSLGMHMAVALQKWVVAWFGPTCAHEIELYGRGVKVPARVSCGPCWKRSCAEAVMCYDRVDFNDILSGIEKGVHWLSSSSSKRRFPEISF